MASNRHKTINSSFSFSPESKINTVTSRILQSIYPFNNVPPDASFEQPTIPTSKRSSFISRLTYLYLTSLSSFLAAIFVIWVIVIFQFRDLVLQASRLINTILLYGVEVLVAAGVMGIRFSYSITFFITTLLSIPIEDAGKNGDKEAKDYVKPNYDGLLRFNVVHHLFWNGSSISFSRNFKDLALPSKIVPLEILVDLNKENIVGKSKKSKIYDDLSNVLEILPANNKNFNYESFKGGVGDHAERKLPKTSHIDKVEETPTGADETLSEEIAGNHHFRRHVFHRPNRYKEKVASTDNFEKVEYEDTKKSSTESAMKQKQDPLARYKNNKIISLKSSTPSTISMVKMLTSPSDIATSSKFNKMLKYGSNAAAKNSDI